MLLRQLFFVVGLMIFPPFVSAQVVGVNRIEVNVQSGKKYILMQDSEVREQWYYAPLSVDMSESGGANESSCPAISLVSVEYRAGSNGYAKSAVASFEFKYGMSEEDKIEIIGRLSREQQIDAPRIVGLPLDGAVLNIFKREDSDIRISDDFGVKLQSNTTIFPGQSINLATNMNGTGSDLYKEMLMSQVGVPISIQYRFKQLSPKYGFAVKIKLDQLIRHLSSAEGKSMRLQLSVPVLGGLLPSRAASIEVSRVNQKVFDSMRQSGFITVETIAGTGNDSLSYEKMAPQIDLIVKELSAKLLDLKGRPERVEPAVVSEALGSSSGIGVKHAFAAKEVTSDLKVDVVYDFSGRIIFDNYGVAYGVLRVNEKALSENCRVFRSTHTEQTGMNVVLPYGLTANSRVAMNLLIKKDGRNKQSYAFLWDGSKWVKPNSAGFGDAVFSQYIPSRVNEYDKVVYSYSYTKPSGVRVKKEYEENFVFGDAFANELDFEN